MTTPAAGSTGNSSEGNGSSLLTGILGTIGFLTIVGLLIGILVNMGKTNTPVVNINALPASQAPQQPVYVPYPVANCQPGCPQPCPQPTAPVAVAGGDTYVTYCPPAVKPDPVTFQSGYKTGKKVPCGAEWSDESSFVITSPPGGRDAINANATAHRWNDQLAVAHGRAMDQVAKQPDIKYVTNTVVRDRPVYVGVPQPVAVPYPAYSYPSYPWYSYRRYWW